MRYYYENIVPLGRHTTDWCTLSQRYNDPSQRCSIHRFFIKFDHRESTALETHVFLQRVLAASLEPIVRAGYHVKIPIYVQPIEGISVNENFASKKCLTNKCIINKHTFNANIANANTSSVIRTINTDNDVLDLVDNTINELTDEPKRSQNTTLSTENYNIPVIRMASIRENFIIRFFAIIFPIKFVTCLNESIQSCMNINRKKIQIIFESNYSI